MNEKNDFRFSDIIKSFKIFPRIFSLFYEIAAVKVIQIMFIYIIMGLFPATSIRVTQHLLNVVQLNAGGNYNEVIIPLAVYLITNFIISCTAVYKSRLESILKIDLSYKINMLLMEKNASLELKDYENSDMYDMIRRAQSEGVDRQYSIFTNIIGIVSQFIGLIALSSILFSWKPWILIVLFIVPILSTMSISNLGHQQFEIEVSRTSDRRQSSYLSYLMSNDIAIKEIKIYGIGRYLIDKFSIIQKNFISVDKKIIKKRTNLLIIYELLDQIVAGVLLIIIIKDTFNGNILFGSTIAYLRSISSIDSSIQGILNSLTSVYQNNLYVTQLFEYLDYNDENQNNDDEVKTEIDEIFSVEFKNVSFKYPTRTEYALKDINIHIIKGNTIALVGENGSGKSTLVKLLCGLYDTYEGEILINDISMKKINQENLKKQLGVVFQDFNKYEMTLKENVALGKLEFLNSEDKILEALTFASGSDIPQSIKDGLVGQLGVWFKGGVQLSGGQWQKIALARANIRDASIYILDEPSASLDPITELRILENIKKMYKNKLGIIISHRLESIKRVSDNIIVLEGGKIVEAGSHDELMYLEGAYSLLYDARNKNISVF